VIEQGRGTPRELDGGQTGLERANQFVTVRTAGVRELVSRLQELGNVAVRQRVLRKCLEAAAAPVEASYEAKARAREATGNLADAVDHKFVGYDEGAAVIVGPRQTGPVGSRPGIESGNHAWLVEFGTGSRSPGSRGRRTYVNVHQMINRRMTRRGSFDNGQFQRMSRGYYFLMGSINEPSRQGKGKSGYSRDFAGPGSGGDGKPQHPITLSPGETIAPMPALGLMERTINETSARSFAILRSSLENEIQIRGLG
jgi:hypothetical protein